jgi:hypothetical protein
MGGQLDGYELQGGCWELIENEQVKRGDEIGGIHHVVFQKPHQCAYTQDISNCRSPYR